MKEVGFKEEEEGLFIPCWQHSDLWNVTCKNFVILEGCYVYLQDQLIPSFSQRQKFHTGLTLKQWLFFLSVVFLLKYM